MAILSKMSILAKVDPAFKACCIGMIGKELGALGFAQADSALNPGNCQAYLCCVTYNFPKPDDHQN